MMRFSVLAVFAAAFGIAFATVASAQSLDIRNPTPLVAGENRGTLDNMVGPQYWLISCHKGKLNIAVHFTSMGLFGNPTTTTIEIVLHEANGKVLGSRPLTSTGQGATLNWPGTCASVSTITLELRPTGSNLVRAGGDYSIVVDGDAVDYGRAGAGGDPIVGTYAVMVCAPDFQCDSSLAIHFAPDGSVRLTDGHSGKWAVFDPDAKIYSVVIGPDRYSLKLIPGRGLFGTNDLSVPVFQAVRPN